MTLDVGDVSRLTTANMRFVEPVLDVVGLKSTLTAEPQRAITLHGKRHSQGGQVLLDDALAIDLDPLQKVTIEGAAGTGLALVECGATWDHLHAALVRHPIRWAPCTHQSSPFFSIGGSLAVNCHGRDPSQPPLAVTTERIEVLRADGSTCFASRTENPTLFSTVLGGYGAGGVILRAWLHLKPEKQLKHTATLLSLDAYCQRLATRAQSSNWPDMHYAFLKFSPNKLFERVVAVDSVDTGKTPSEPIKPESFLGDHAMALLYNVLRTQSRVKGALWNAFENKAPTMLTGEERQLNAMRANVRFSLFMGEDTTDLLQEYFLPVDKLQEFLTDCARPVLEKAQVNLLSSSVRVVQRDGVSLLAYSPKGTMASVVLNFNIRKADAIPDGQGNSPLNGWSRELIEGALAFGGTFYLPYARTATLDQFRRGYPQWQAFHNQRREFDPDCRFDNSFLRAYTL